MLKFLGVIITTLFFVVAYPMRLYNHAMRNSPYGQGVLMQHEGAQDLKTVLERYELAIEKKLNTAHLIQLHACMKNACVNLLLHKQKILEKRGSSCEVHLLNDLIEQIKSTRSADRIAMKTIILQMKMLNVFMSTADDADMICS